MIFPLRTPGRRIAFTLAASLLAHGLLLWLPHITLPHFEAQLPPLTAKLEPLPNIAAQQAPKKRKAKRAGPPAPPADLPSPQAASAALAEPGASAVALAEPAASAVALAEPAASAVALAEPAAAASTPVAPPAVPPPLLPRHAQLRFAVRKGEDGFKVGEVLHRLDIIDGRYTVESATQTTGLARLFKSYNLNQTSNGTVSATGLRPDDFSEEKNDGGHIQTLTAMFDWQAHVLHFSAGGESPLSENAQDALSILYQLSQLPLQGDLLQVNISNGKKLDSYELRILAGETVSTALGKLPAVHLRKIHGRGEPGLEIWLGREYRLLPVKVQYLEPDGSVAASITITDIRVADE